MDSPSPTARNMTSSRMSSTSTYGVCYPSMWFTYGTSLLIAASTYKGVVCAPNADPSSALKARSDEKRPTRLPIGYGSGGYAFEFDLPLGKTEDTGFLQVFVSTKPLDMGWIEQKSPFKAGFMPSGRLGASRETVEKGQIWDAFHAVITMKI
ncbi:hypothetical protein B0H13DRAFT_142984 [Mycena leptocephala]|nr:hypothetical protein B0H13DRAFT_142984 [Mycena leptocephala]